MSEQQREKMIAKQLVNRGIKDEKVLESFRQVPRQEFVQDEDNDYAYADGPLPIGHGQTISQPYIVALMTEALEIKKTDRVMEIGTGSGYQTAILANLAGQVYSVEKVSALAKAADKKLKNLGYENVQVKVGDGTKGWKKNAPYDAIMVTAASPQVPPSLLEQLSPQGRMVIPVGDRYFQKLMLLVKTLDGEMKTINLGDCRFVPLLGEEGWDS
ncbi:protein-L-isoaspartate(D-aspartate) O-methyltransferase [Candidatus Contubernalis alkalaceticus]|nr:protein-L-isoaspartate(D-aspartate) O-methyltransferase [Candidatus Contubernalis alkalaceticus]